jgi:hypothetical protein
MTVLKVEIDNLDNEIGDHFPQLIDDNGFDTFPTFQAYQAPVRSTRTISHRHT